MHVRVLFILSVNFLTVLAAERNSPCRTPNLESASCVPVESCKVIYEAIQTQNGSAIEFAKQSQCGFDTVPLVCCGTTGYPTPSTTSIFGIFTREPEVTERGPTSTSKRPKIEINWGNLAIKELPDRTVCGLEKETNRVIGGNITDLDEFPWMTAIEYKSKFTNENAGIRCGGSIINNRYVLTAAHCIIDKEFQIISVWLGEWKISTDPDCQELVANVECAELVTKMKLKEEIPHPYYSKKTGNNDIGLLRLERDIKFSDYIRPICLPPPNLPFPELNTLLTVAGWGATENGTQSDVKLKVAVPLLSNTICREKLKSRPISPNQLCAGGERERDTCQGDSGGPLMRTYQDDESEQPQWYQEGVVAWGTGCGRAGYPAIYTRVSRYITWILNILSEN